MNNKINVCIVGCGNCANSLLQGLVYYKSITNKNEPAPGLMHNVLGTYLISDIKVVAGFDVDFRKVGKDISNAIFSQPNNTKKFSDVSFLNVDVIKGPVLDGIADHMHNYFQIDENQKELPKDEIISTLKERNTNIIINYLPVGSQRSTEFWASIALESNCAFINAIPQFIASDLKWAEKFRQANLPIIGDDVKSQLGSTIVNRALIQLIIDRGGKIDDSHQINVGGNTDFANMLDQSRLESKKISKTESVKTLIPYNVDVYAGPNGYISHLKDNKISHMRIDFRIFGDVPCSIDCKLSVEDSPNSSGCIIDAIRIAKIGLDKEIGGPLIGPSAWLMKHPPIQYSDDVAHRLTEDFINIS